LILQEGTVANNGESNSGQRPATRRTALQFILGEEFTIPYYPTLAKAVGGPGCAIFISYLARWEKYSDDGWVFRTKEEIEEDTGLTIEMQRRIPKRLQDGEILEVKRAGNPARLYYRIDWEKVEAQIKTWGNPRSSSGESPDQELGKAQISTNNGRSKGRTNNPIGEAAPPSEATQVEKGSPPKKKNGEDMSPARILVDRIYDKMAVHGFILTDFPYQLGRAKWIFENHPKPPTPEEIENLPEDFVTRYQMKGSTDAVDTLNWSRQQIARKSLEREWAENKKKAREEKREDLREEFQGPAPWEAVNPFGPEGERVRDKAYALDWYLTNYPDLAPGLLRGWIDQGRTHSEILSLIEKDMEEEN
jgi:hypothetical protein